jgi:hypothetical protein
MTDYPYGHAANSIEPSWPIHKRVLAILGGQVANRGRTYRARPLKEGHELEEGGHALGALQDWHEGRLRRLNTITTTIVIITVVITIVTITLIFFIIIPIAITTTHRACFFCPPLHDGVTIR